MGGGWRLAYFGRAPFCLPANPPSENEVVEHDFWNTHDTTEYLDLSKTERLTPANPKPSNDSISFSCCYTCSKASRTARTNATRLVSPSSRLGCRGGWWVLDIGSVRAHALPSFADKGRAMTINYQATVPVTFDEEAAMARYVEALETERRETLLAHADLIQDFRTYARSKGVALGEGDFDYDPKIGIIAKQSGIFWKLAHELQRDKDGLVLFSDLKAAFPNASSMAGYLRGGQFTAMAHPHFRRALNERNNFAPHFVSRFWQMQPETLAAFLAVDEDRVRINRDDLCYVELDTWYGAKFAEDVRSISAGIAKLRPPLDISESQTRFLFSDAHSLQIAWSEKAGIKTFQGIEFKTDQVRVSVGEIDYFPARYIHAEFDLQRGVFRHFDGAMQYYTSAEYLEQRDSDLNHNTKHIKHVKARSKKLFKFNCDMQVSVMSDLCSHFWTGNPLAIEYFSGAYPPHVDETLTRIRQRKLA